MPTLDGKHIIYRYNVSYGKCKGCGKSKKRMFIFHSAEWGVWCGTKCFVEKSQPRRLDTNKFIIKPVARS